MRWQSVKQPGFGYTGCGNADWRSLGRVKEHIPYSPAVPCQVRAWWSSTGEHWPLSRVGKGGPRCSTVCNRGKKGRWIRREERQTKSLSSLLRREWTESMQWNKNHHWKEMIPGCTYPNKILNKKAGHRRTQTVGFHLYKVKKKTTGKINHL